MATSAGEDLGRAAGGLLQIIFSLLFPFMFIVSCLTSFVLTFVFHLPQFALLAYLTALAVGYAGSHFWGAIGLAGFVLLSLPLTWVAFKEQAARASGMIGSWTAAALAIAFTAWVVSAWPFNSINFQELVFAVLLFTCVGGVIEALLTTLKIFMLSRPQPGREVVDAQKAHGDARVADQSEAVALLRSKK